MMASHSVDQALCNLISALRGRGLPASNIEPCLMQIKTLEWFRVSRFARPSTAHHTLCMERSNQYTYRIVLVDRKPTKAR